MADLPELVEGVITHRMIYGSDVETRKTIKIMQELPAPLPYAGYPLVLGDGENVFGWVDLAKHGDRGFLVIVAHGPRDASYYVEPVGSPVRDEATARDNSAGLWRMMRAAKDGLDAPFDGLLRGGPDS